jgi:hypothetical protein
MTYATGGIVTEVGGYRIHTFISSGYFYPIVSGDVVYIVIGGGGGGGSNKGAGGGAGGYYSCVAGEQSGGGSAAGSPLAVYAGYRYTVTVGAGGAVDTNGLSSYFPHTIAV